jgi:Flp pilus assembly protein TadG
MNFSTHRNLHTHAPAGQKRGERGATLVEFGLFFLLFLMVAVGLMELGRGVWTFTTVAHAARAGARYAITHGKLNPIPVNGTTIEDIVKANAVGRDPTDVTVNTKYEKYDEVNSTWQTGAIYNERNNVVEVKVSYPFRLVTGPLVLAQNTIQLSSTSRMIVGN